MSGDMPGELPDDMPGDMPDDMPVIPRCGGWRLDGGLLFTQ